MATSDNIQYLSAAAGDVNTSSRRVVETYLCGSTVTAGGVIAAGDWVQFETAATDGIEGITVIKAGTASLGNALVAGVALEAGTVVGARIKVVIRGYVADANVATAVTAGTALTVDTPAGRGVAAVAADHTHTCGVAVGNAAANKCDVIVFGIQH
tara:strand:+ start:2797 stop:3261 length:465 start_codon:yes stop_codon:yes gene_type:complete